MNIVHEEGTLVQGQTSNSRQKFQVNWGKMEIGCSQVVLAIFSQRKILASKIFANSQSCPSRTRLIESN